MSPLEGRRCIQVLIAFLLLVPALPAATGQSATNVLAKHVTAKAVEGSSPYQPVLVTSTFFTDDNDVYSWLNFVNVTSGSHVIRWDWFDPSTARYTTFNSTINGPGGIFVWGHIPISGSAAANRTGTWQVKVYFDGTLTGTDTFTLVNPPWGFVKGATLGNYLGGTSIAVDSAQNLVYTMGSGDTGQFCVTVGTQTACVPAHYLRVSDGTTLAPLASYPTELTGQLPTSWQCTLDSPYELRVIDNSSVRVGTTTANFVDVLSGGCVWLFWPPSTSLFSAGFPWSVAEHSSNGGLPISWMEVDPSSLTTYFGGGSYLYSRAAGASMFQELNLGSMYNGDRFALDSATGTIYAVGTGNTVLVINSSLKLGAVIHVPIQYTGASGTFHSSIAVNPKTHYVYLDGQNGLVVIDGRTNSIVTTINNPAASGGPIAIDGKNNLVYVVSGGNPLSVINGYDNNVITDIPIPGSCPSGVWTNIDANSVTGFVYTANGLSNNICAFTNPISPAGSPGQVVINEVALNPPPGIGASGKNSTQWVELYNKGSTTVDLSGSTLTPSCGESYSGQLDLKNIAVCASGVSAYIPDGTKIPPKGYFIYETPGQGGSVWLNSVNDSLVLRDSAGRIVDWTPPLTDPLAVKAYSFPADAETWQRYPNGQDTHTMADWRLMPATKGFQNLNTTTTNVQAAQRAFPVVVTSNSTVSQLQFNQAQKQLSLLVAGPANTHGITRIGFSNTLLNGTLSVQLDGAPAAATIDRNATYTTITVNYSHSSHTITVTGTDAFGVITTTTTSSTTIQSTITLSTSTQQSTSSPSSATSTATTLTPTTSTSSGTASTSTGSGGIPEYPYQLVATTVFTVMLVATYLMVRRNKSLIGRNTLSE